jgi:hypothetical protein
VKLIINPRTDQIKDYAVLELILTGGGDDWQIAGTEVIDALGYWLDIVSDELITDYHPKLLETLRRIACNIEKGIELNGSA